MSKAVLSVRIDNDELKKFDAVAAYCRTSRADLVQLLIRRFLASYDTQRDALVADLKREGVDYVRRSNDVPD